MSWRCRRSSLLQPIFADDSRRVRQSISSSAAADTSVGPTVARAVLATRDDLLVRRLPADRRIGAAEGVEQFVAELAADEPAAFRVRADCVEQFD